jgi:hypothetical protein
MRLVEIDWSPADRQLRQFGVICLFALPLLGWLWSGIAWVVGLLALVGAIIGIAGVLKPRVVRPVFLVLMIIALPIGMAVGELGMLLVYFGVFLPIGAMRRLMGSDAIQMRFDRRAKTYWQAKKQPEDAASYYRQS